MINVFISQPMAGRQERDILAERQAVMEDIRKKFNDPDMEDVGYCSEVKDGAGNVWYLGGSIQHMDDADIIVFVPGWQNAKGCCMEFAIVKNYMRLYDWIIYQWHPDNHAFEWMMGRSWQYSL